MIYPAIPPQTLGPIYFMAISGGILVGSVFLLEVLLADIVDQDPRGNGSYGIYFGVWKLSAKAARAAAIGLSGVLLEWVGFQSKAEVQSESTVAALGYLFGPGVGIFFIAGGILVLFSKNYEISNSTEES